MFSKLKRDQNIGVKLLNECTNYISYVYNKQKSLIVIIKQQF